MGLQEHVFRWRKKHTHFSKTKIAIHFFCSITLRHLCFCSSPPFHPFTMEPNGISFIYISRKYNNQAKFSKKRKQKENTHASPSNGRLFNKSTFIEHISCRALPSILMFSTRSSTHLDRYLQRSKCFCYCRANCVCLQVLRSWNYDSTACAYMLFLRTTFIQPYCCVEQK